MWRETALSFLAAVLTVNAQSAVPADYENIPVGLELKSLPSNSLYTRWRPRYHVLIPSGRMNDPCGPMYDPTRDEYHVFYQSAPTRINGGNVTWAHAISNDLVTWTDISGWQNEENVAIKPSEYSVPSYDWLGAFSGGAQPVNLKGERDGNLTLMYTGCVVLPDNWKVPYQLGAKAGDGDYATEMQNIATSSDGGRTWQKYDGNPWLDTQVGGWNTTGFRDPVFFPNTRLDSILGHGEGDKWYMVLGSGIRGVGPRIPLLTANSNDLTNWTFQGALWEAPINYTWGGDRTETGNWGANWELAGLYDEVAKVEHGGDGVESKWIVSFGAEGYPDEWHPAQRWTLFVLGDMIRRANGSAELDVQASGPLDWGNLYAVNGFLDEKNSRRVLWGWSDEDMSYDGGLPQQGFAGSFGLPRELYVLKDHNITAPSDGDVNRGRPQIWESTGTNSYTITTVGQRPLPEVVAAIRSKQSSNPIQSSQEVDSDFDLGVNSSRFHLQTTFSSLPDASDSENYAGIRLRSSPNAEEFTEVRYYPANSSVVLDRKNSTLLPLVTRDTIVGNYEPFTYTNGTTETLTFNIFVDGSLLEIYINERFALTSRIYPSRADALGASIVVEGDATVEWAEHWEMELNVWPERPLNASSPISSDPYYETTITFENPYLPIGYQIYPGN